MYTKEAFASSHTSSVHEGKGKKTIPPEVSSRFLKKKSPSSEGDGSEKFQVNLH